MIKRMNNPHLFIIYLKEVPEF